METIGSFEKLRSFMAYSKPDFGEGALGFIVGFSVSDLGV